MANKCVKDAQHLLVIREMQNQATKFGTTSHWDSYNFLNMENCVLEDLETLNIYFILLIGNIQMIELLWKAVC